MATAAAGAVVVQMTRPRMMAAAPSPPPHFGGILQDHQLGEDGGASDFKKNMADFCGVSFKGR